MRERRLLSEIDLTKSIITNFTNMTRSEMQSRLGNEEELPLSPKISKWSTEDNMLEREYVIENRNHFSYFLNSILDHANQINHDPILIIKYPSITVSLTTDTIGDVTDRDIDFSKFVDEVYEDVTFLHEEF